MTELHMDYETASRVDLIKRGTYEYAMGDTAILMAGWGFDDEEPELWLPGMPFPERIIEHWKRGDRRGTLAHNAAFERLNTHHALARQVPEIASIIRSIPIDHWYCTAAQAAARALPRALDNLGRCLAIDVIKNQQGKDLIRHFCIPWLGQAINWEQGKFNPRTGPKWKMFGDYCLDDVNAERAAGYCSPPLTEEEFDDYLLNEEINDRGVRIDRKFATAALQYADEELAEIHGELSRLTNGQITTARQFGRIKDWLQPYFDQDPDLEKLLTRHKTDRRSSITTVKVSLDKANRWKLLTAEEDFDPRVLELARLLDLAGSTSVSKYAALLGRSQSDGTLRGAFMYCGAGQTKRYSSVGAQLHNMRRDTPKNYRKTRANIMAGRPIAQVMDTLASMLRPTIRGAMTGGDLSQIEARVLPWLSDTAGGRAKLQLFADGVDVYVVTAEGIWPRQGEAKRQEGKVCELALGFQGGYRALQTMGQVYRVAFSDGEAKGIVTTWRGNNVWVTRFWNKLQAAAIRAVHNPGVAQKAGLMTYVYDEDWDMLFCTGPNGSTITYPRPRLEFDEKWGRFNLSAIKANWQPAQGEKEWPRISLYGGLLAENATQFMAAEVLKDIMKRLKRKGAPICAHVHDEVVLASRDPKWSKIVTREMTRVQPWMKGLPLDCEVWSNDRYAK